MADSPFYIVARLWIRSGLELQFEAYASKVARIMARYGGVVERAIRVTKATDGSSDEPFEIHVLRFPTRDRYDAYVDDAERQSLSAERASIITKTESLVGTPGPAYSS
jgi:antibiotic biosynthesis monooxygenase (ABM) superfamily enzyme